MRFRKPLPFAIGMALAVFFLAGCGTPAATPTSIPPTVTRTPVLLTETPLPLLATDTPLPLLGTETPVSLLATDTPVPPLSTPGPASVAGDVAVSSEARISSPDVPADDLRTLADGNNAFAFDLYSAIRDGEDNLLYSPYSISVALAMVYAGARGDTQEQMADTLHFTLPQERLHPAFNALDLDLGSRSHATVHDESGKEVEEVAFQLEIANAVWGQTGYPFRPEYLDLLALNYGAGVRLVDFRANASAAVDAINQWISEATKDRIRNIVDTIPTDTRLVLANAIYFNAHWDLPFDEADTADEPFHLLAGEEEIVPMMHQTDRFLYTEGDGYQAIQLPYLNREVAMVIVLPTVGRFHEIEERLTGDWVQDVLTGFQMDKVILTMPKFRYETPVISLGRTLSAMGMPDAFSPDDADFSGITEPQAGLPLFIGEVLHKAFIDVNEQRTEAAAATIVIMPPGAAPERPTEPPPIVMKIDRPFVFLIRDFKTDTILFIGRVMNPSGE
jgi:serpin B